MPKTLMPHEKFFTSLRDFAGQLTAKFSAMAAGEPEDQLKPPVDHLFGFNAFELHRGGRRALSGENCH